MRATLILKAESGAILSETPCNLNRITGEVNSDITDMTGVDSAIVVYRQGKKNVEEEVCTLCGKYVLYAEQGVLVCSACGG